MLIKLCSDDEAMHSSVQFCKNDTLVCREGYCVKMEDFEQREAIPS